MFKLERPIAFIDIESTGLNVQTDRIVEISICILNTDYSRETKTRYVNPEMPIPAASTEIHGIDDAMVAGCPTFRQISKAIYSLIQGKDLAGFNSNRYDYPLLMIEFDRAGIDWDYKQHEFVDVGNIFKIKEPRTLIAASKFYCGIDLDEAHSAQADTEATVDVFLSQVDRYDLTDKTVSEIALMSNYDKQILDLSGKFSYDKDGDICLNFKYPGEKAKDHLDFIGWMLYKADFPPDTRKICEQILVETNAPSW